MTVSENRGKELCRHRLLLPCTNDCIGWKMTAKIVAPKQGSGVLHKPAPSGYIRGSFGAGGSMKDANGEWMSVNSPLFPGTLRCALKNS